MAPKPRTPPPPRRVQAPRQRGTVTPETERRTRLILYAVAATGIVALAAVILFLTLGRGASSAQGALQDAGCKVETYPAAAAGLHVTEPVKRSDYNSWPPTSGPHHPEPAPYDVYTEPVEQYRVVHALEHGGVTIQYGEGITPQTVEEIVTWYRKAPNGLVVAPLPNLGEQIALAAWTTAESSPNEGGEGVVARCPRFDEAAFDAFVDKYAFKGPERFPADLLTPGT